MQISIALDKLRLETGSIAEHVLIDEDLPVAVFPRTDAYGESRHALSYDFGDSLRHTLKGNGEGSGL